MLSAAQRIGIANGDLEATLAALLQAVNDVIPWANITGQPTTVGGYGITDMASQSVSHAASATSATSATSAGAVPWSGVGSPPPTYAPTLQTSAAAALTPGTSPWTYTNASAFLQAITLAGAGITDITLSAGGSLGAVLAGQFIVRPGETITTTFSSPLSVSNSVNLA